MRALLASAFLIAMLAVPAHASAVTVVSLTFDDGRGSQAAAANALNAHGLDGTFYINSAAIGGGGSLSLTQLHAIADAGHEIGSHGVYHINLPANDADEQRRLLCDDRNWLLQQGFEVTSYAYPYSSYAGTAQQSVAACGFTSGRAGWELNIGGNCGQTCAESIPPRNPWAVRTFKPVDVETSVADLQAQVLNALNHGGGWVPIMFHDICSNCGFYAMSTADLNAFLDWLATQPVEVRTVRDVMDVTTIAPPVQSPAPPPRDPANLLQNPGMETIGAGWVLPFQIPARCWQQDGAWSVEAEWARVSGGAHSGSWSMTIDLPSNDPVGYHELVASPDLGGCAVPAAGGDRFRFTGWYRSEGQVSVVHRVRQGPWSWQSATIDATLPPAAAWTPFSRRPAGPAGRRDGDGAGHPHQERGRAVPRRPRADRDRRRADDADADGREGRHRRGHRDELAGRHQLRLRLQRGLHPGHERHPVAVGRRGQHLRGLERRLRRHRRLHGDDGPGPLGDGDVHASRRRRR